MSEDESYDSLYEKAVANPYPIKRRRFPVMTPSVADEIIAEVLKGKLPKRFYTPLPRTLPSPRFDLLAKKSED
jgi:hypothetical protein